jgi:hypothetical protein
MSCDPHCPWIFLQQNAAGVSPSFADVVVPYQNIDPTLMHKMFAQVLNNSCDIHLGELSTPCMERDVLLPLKYLKMNIRKDLQGVIIICTVAWSFLKVTYLLKLLTCVASIHKFGNP